MLRAASSGLSRKIVKVGIGLGAEGAGAQHETQQEYSQGISAHTLKVSYCADFYWVDRRDRHNRSSRFLEIRLGCHRRPALSLTTKNGKFNQNGSWAGSSSIAIAPKGIS